MTGPNTPYSKLSASQVLVQSFNEAEDRLRVDAVATIESGTLEIVLTHEDDSIRLGDGTNFIGSTTVGGHVGLDVNVVGGNSTISGTVTTNLNGLNSFQTSQYTVGTSAVQLTPSPLSGRSSLSIKVRLTTGAALYIGPSSGVTTSNGYILFNGDSIQMDITPAHQVWAIADTVGQTAYVIELG